MPDQTVEPSLNSSSVGACPCCVSSANVPSTTIVGASYPPDFPCNEVTWLSPKSDPISLSLFTCSAPASRTLKRLRKGYQLTAPMYIPIRNLAPRWPTRCENRLEHARDLA